MKKSLNFRLLAWAATSIFVVAISLTVYSAFSIQEELFAKAELESEKYAEDISAKVELKISEAFEVIRSFARILSHTKDKNLPVKLSRVEVVEMMKTQFLANPTIFGLNTGWEPNAFDGKDAEHVGKIPSDNTGRFVTYMTRKDNGVLLEPLIDYEKEGTGDYYLMPKKLMKDVIIPPYSYPVDGKTVLLMTLASPVIKDGQFYGEVGADVDLTFFQTLTDTKGLPEGSRIVIYDKSGTIVGFSGDEKKLLKNIFTEKIADYTSYTAARLTKPEDYIRLDNYNMSVLTDIKLNNELWFVEVIIPKSVIVGPIYKEIATLVGIGLTVAILALGVGYFLIQKITGKIIALADRLKKSAEVTRNGSNTVKDASFQISSATQEQASAIQETATTLEEISAMVVKSVDNAKNSSEQANNSFEIATEGKRTVEQMRQSMDDIRSSNKHIAEQIEHSNREIEGIIQVIQDISEKTKVINDIVFQTKLLSFNASVEAARAGDQGKGFAVVAEEVGNLAAMSGNSSKEINELLEKSISRVGSTISETKKRIDTLIKEGHMKVDQGTKVAERCETILDQIVSNVSSVKILMGDVTVAAEEQSKGVKNISDAMNMLDNTTQDNTKTVHQTANQSELLFKEADNLSDIILMLEEEVYGENKKAA
jgi:methyl-accepting chemotaxis protein